MDGVDPTDVSGRRARSCSSSRCRVGHNRAVTFEADLVALGMPVPDSAFARQARERIVDVAEPYLVHHSMRAYAWAVELALHDGRDFDSEILYVSAALHDIGLVPAYDLGGCFETDGAVAAEHFALEHGQPADRAKAIHQVIELHMAASL